MISAKQGLANKGSAGETDSEVGMVFGLVTSKTIGTDDDGA